MHFLHFTGVKICYVCRAVARILAWGVLKLVGEDRRGPKGRQRGRGSWGGGSQPPPHQLGGLGEHCKLPQWGPGRSPGCQAFSCILWTLYGFSWHFSSFWPRSSCQIFFSHTSCKCLPWALVMGFLMPSPDVILQTLSNSPIFIISQ